MSMMQNCTLRRTPQSLSRQACRSASATARRHCHQSRPFDRPRRQMSQSNQLKDLFRMESLSDGTISSLQWWFGVIAIVASAIGMVSATGTLLIRQESSRRQSIKESERAARLTSTESALGDAQRQLTASHERVVRLEAAQRGRLFSDEEVSGLKSALEQSPRGKVSIVAMAGVPDAMPLALQLRKVFKELGYEAELVATAMPFGHPTGIEMEINPKDAHWQTAIAVQNAFEAIRRPFSACGFNENVPVGTIHIGIWDDLLSPQKPNETLSK